MKQYLSTRSWIDEKIFVN